MRPSATAPLLGGLEQFKSEGAAPAERWVVGATLTAEKPPASRARAPFGDRHAQLMQTAAVPEGRVKGVGNGRSALPHVGPTNV
jgi:hypothetical protein